MKSILIAATTAMCLTTTSLNADIIMGIVPQQSPLKLLKVWSPIAKYLSEQTGDKVIFKTEKSIGKFEKVLYSGGYDFAYMNPYHYVVANKAIGYTAEIRANKDIRGILVMKNIDGIKDIKDKKYTYLFPSPNAFAATLLTKYDLAEKYGVTLETLSNSRYVNSHDSVYKGVSRGIGNIGGGIERTFKNLNDEKAKKSLHVVHTTDAYPSHPFAFKPTMTEENKKKIVDALLNMPKHYLDALSMKSLKHTDNAEYDSVKKLAIKLNLIKE